MALTFLTSQLPNFMTQNFLKYFHIHLCNQLRLLLKFSIKDFFGKYEQKCSFHSVKYQKFT